MTKLVKEMASICAVGIAAIITLILILFFKSIYDNSRSIGNVVGEELGEMVGPAVGSFEGVTQTYWEGMKDGKRQGLSASDTEVSDMVDFSSFEKYILETATLQVLVARVSMEDYHEVGDKYAALYLLPGEVVFTVNLWEAQIDIDQNTVKVKIPQPKLGDFTIYETGVEKIAEWKSTFFDGSMEDGYTAYMNSLDQIKENAEEYISNYDVLFHQAREAAKKQVQMLAETMNISGNSVSVEFLTGSQE